jgi:thiamine transporter
MEGLKTEGLQASKETIKKGGIDTGTIAMVGVTVALAAVLNLMPLFEMPQGGSVSLEMVPILFLALYRGPKVGIIGGVVYGLVNLAMKPFIFHPAQVILDYPLAFGLLGLAGFFRPDNALKIAAGTFLGALGRFGAAVLSGAIFFASYAPKGQSPWLYSMIYNGSYMLPATIIAIPTVFALLQAFKKAEGGRPLRR